MKSLNSLTLIWLSIAVCLGIVEIISTSFGFILAALSAVIAAMLSVLRISFPVQVVTFAGVLVLSLIFLRPRLVARLASTQKILGRAEALVGQLGYVTEGSRMGQGRVSVAQEDWAARAQGELPEGAKIRIIGHDGIVLLVEVLTQGIKE